MILARKFSFVLTLVNWSWRSLSCLFINKGDEEKKVIPIRYGHITSLNVGKKNPQRNRAGVRVELSNRLCMNFRNDKDELLIKLDPMAQFYSKDDCNALPSTCAFHNVTLTFSHWNVAFMFPPLDSGQVLTIASNSKWFLKIGDIKWYGILVVLFPLGTQPPCVKKLSLWQSRCWWEGWPLDPSALGWTPSWQPAHLNLPARGHPESMHPSAPGSHPSSASWRKDEPSLLIPYLQYKCVSKINVSFSCKSHYIFGVFSYIHFKQLPGSHHIQLLMLHH